MSMIVALIISLVLCFLAIASVPYLYYGFNTLRLKALNTQTEYIYPEISIVINAYKEGARLHKRLINLLETTYPKNKLNIYVVNDGADEETEKYARMDYGIPINVFSPSTRFGKNICVNKMLDKVHTEIVVFTDADVINDKNTLAELIAPFKDKNVGAVTGDVVVCGDSNFTTDNESAYRSVYGKMCEVDNGSVINFNGQIMACRRGAVSDINEHGADDANMAVEALHNGYKTLYVNKAKVYETQPLTAKAQFKQKMRRASALITSLSHADCCFVSVMRRWMCVISPLLFLTSYILLCLLCPCILFLILFCWRFPNFILFSFVINQFYLICGIFFKVDISTWDVVDK